MYPTNRDGPRTTSAGGSQEADGTRSSPANTESPADPAIPGTQTLDRGLTVLRAVAGGATALSEIVAITQIPRSTAHRLVQLLIARGYLQRTDATLRLGGTLVELGFQALHASPLPVVARPVLDRLAREFADTVHLAIADAGQVLYLDKIASSRGPQMRSRVGYRMPLSSTGVGKALQLDQAAAQWEEQYLLDGGTCDGIAAHLEKMGSYARRGVAQDLEENEPGIRCVAAPVRDGSGAIVAAVSIAATRPYMPAARMRGLAAVLTDAAREIGRGLGYR